MKSFLLSGLFLTITFWSWGQEENWDVYMAMYEKGPGSTVLDMSYGLKAPLKEYPFLLITGVGYPGCDSTGLPLKTAFDELYAVSDKIAAALSGYKTKLAGTFTYQCERLDYYYLADTVNLRNKLASVYKNNFPGLSPIIKIREDTAWEAYLTFLYPNEETLEYMFNEKIIINLIKAGDDLSKARKTDRWLHFSNTIDRDRFAAYAISEKYTIESKNLVKKTERPYQLRISRIDKVDMESITRITQELRKKALEYQGQYDGWETFVIK